MIRVLHIVGSMNLGGQETFIMNIYRKIDRSRIQFDFVVSNQATGYYDSEIHELGGSIYYIPPIKENIVKRCVSLFNLIKKNKYTIIHRHSAFSIVFIDLLVGMLAGARTRIIHSHADYDPHKLHPFFRGLLIAFSNYRLACSTEAGQWMYGKRNQNFEVLNNGIDTTIFLYNEKARLRIRKELDIDEDCILLGHTGRFIPEKNHIFLFDELAHLKKNGMKVKLCLIGDGVLREKYIAYCNKLRINDDVIFCGIKNNVNDYLSAFDVFMFPSLHEGLGISLIEAEINGLYCLVSEYISKDAIISNRVSILPLDIMVWANKLKDVLLENKHINISNDNVKSFDVNITMKRLEQIYGVAKETKY